MATSDIYMSESFIHLSCHLICLITLNPSGTKQVTFVSKQVIESFMQQFHFTLILSRMLLLRLETRGLIRLLAELKYTIQLTILCLKCELLSIVC